MRTIVESRAFVSVMLSAVVGFAAWHRWPFAAGNAFLQLVLLHKPYLFYGIYYAYLGMLFTTPYLILSTVLSLTYIFLVPRDRLVTPSKLPAYPKPQDRQSLYLVLGERHHPKRPVPSEDPQWLTIPHRGLFTGLAIFGAIGSGKTSGCMIPFAEQIFAYRARDPERRMSGLVLEVKGDFCYKVRQILKTHQREEDYLEVGLSSEVRYNPLYNDQEAYSLAYGLASLLNNLFGKGKEPFWQQAYTNLVKFIILLHQVLYDYVTLFDVYECAINPDRLEEKIREGEQHFQTTESLFVEVPVYLEHGELKAYVWQLDEHTNRMKARHSLPLQTCLETHQIPYERRTDPPAGGEAGTARHHHKEEQFAAVQRWFYHDWKRIEPKLRTSIVEGISVFLSLFDDNPAVKRIFCPPKETYDPIANKDGRYGFPLPPFEHLLEQGKIVALNFPVSSNPGLAKAIGTLMKLDFQRAVLNRIPVMEQHPERHWREILFLCDEYQSFATTGENDPSGDEKFFALSRQAKCIPIVASQSISSLRSALPGESWRTLLQTFRTKIFLSLSDDFSARTASELCGKEEQLKPNYSISENGQDARVSMLTGQATAHRTTLSTSKSYSSQKDWVFEPKTFTELKNAQAIVLAYDGLNPLPPTYCYLKPYFLDPNMTYFEQLARGEI